MALWWHQPLRRAAQTDNSASLVCVFPAFFNCEIGKFSWRRMKTLATLSANGFEAVYVEVVSLIMVDQLGRFFFFRFPPLLTGNYTQWGFYRHCHVCESGRDGTGFVDAVLVQIRTIMTLLIMMNSRNVPTSRTPLISACAEEIYGTVKDMGGDIGPIHSMNIWPVYIRACLNYHKTCRQWHCCVFSWHLTCGAEFQITIYEY